MAGLSAQSSYSEYVFGYSGNAALDGNYWGMTDPLFPAGTLSGLDINGVFYRYTAVKETGDPYVVNVQNEDAVNGGYIFRETDDWSAGGGGTIQKFIPLPYSPVGNWGQGSIEEVGTGHVEDPVVVYSYRIDTDRLQPEIEYTLPTYDIYDALSDQYVVGALEPTDSDVYDDEEVNDSEFDEDDEDRLESALAAKDNALTLANSLTQSAIVSAMNTATNLNNYYAKRLKGGVYKETTVLIDKNIPDNRKALRSLGQQKLHTEMVDQQYGR